jgi:hypothetical protein
MRLGQRSLNKHGALFWEATPCSYLRGAASSSSNSGLPRSAADKEGLFRRRSGGVNYSMTQLDMPTLFVCHGDDGGPRFHPCRQVQEALRAAGIEYGKVIAGHGSPFPFLRGPRPELIRETGTDKLPQLRLPDGTLLNEPRAILSWIKKVHA